MFLTLDQMINNAAKWKYVYAGKSRVPFVVRGVIGKGWGQGPTHSQSLQSIFAHFPGLIVTMPSNPCDVKGILLKSLQMEAPVVILEHRGLYNIKGEVPENRYTLPLGCARKVLEGNDITVVATSIMVPEALKAAEILRNHGITLEIIDPVSLQPLDEKTIIESVQKTGRLIAADTSWMRCGFASEVAAVAAEKAFDYLKAPIRRITLPECPCPVSKALEDVFYPSFRDIVRTAYELLNKTASYDIDVQEIAEPFVGPY
jgi:pyruvate dehydrogenase E1 component beta subunit